MIYLDHAASTPPRPEALAELRRWSDAANASASHRAGQRAREAVEIAREQVAVAIGAHPSEVLFTASGTEADNLAVKGLAWAGADRGRRHVVTTNVEHPAVLESVAWLARHGFEVDLVPARPDGTVDPEAVAAAVRGDTAVVSVMTANNEVGAVNDVVAVTDLLADREIPVHTDAVQAFATLDVRVGAVDALALSGHKFGAPQGVGVAFVRRGVPMEALVHGGGQERGLRSGTYAAAQIAAFGAGVQSAVADRPRVRSAAVRQTDRLAAALADVGGVVRTGPDDPSWRLASHLHITIDGVDTEALTFALDHAGLAASGGAACGAGAVKASHVVEALDLRADAVLRLSVGWTTTDDEIDRAADVLTDVIVRLRAGRPVVTS
jgi:cysteine desulfurase